MKEAESLLGGRGIMREIKLCNIEKALEEAEKYRENKSSITNESIEVIVEVLSVAKLELIKDTQK